jgi:hypothetical protein
MDIVAEAITRRLSDMTNSELSALEARTIAMPASCALEAPGGADNAEGEQSDSADDEAETLSR